MNCKSTNIIDHWKLSLVKTIKVQTQPVPTKTKRCHDIDEKFSLKPELKLQAGLIGVMKNRDNYINRKVMKHSLIKMSITVFCFPLESKDGKNIFLSPLFESMLLSGDLF
jgi:hypothetical protein